MQKKSFALESNFYPENLIQEALESFSDYDISFSDGILMITDESPQVVFDEFTNYVLALSNETL